MFPAILRSATSTGGQSDSLSEDHLGQELVGGNQDQRNWKGIIISLLVIILICTIIIVCILIVTPDSKFYENYTFDDIFKNDSFKIKTYKLSWLQDRNYESTFLSQDDDGNIVIINASSNAYYQVMDTRMLCDDHATKWWPSPTIEMSSANKQFMYLLLACDVKKGFRHSFQAKYKIYMVSLGSYDSADGDGVHVTDVKLPHQKDADFLQFVEWSPHGNSLVIVHDNNIYFKETISAEDDVVQITTDGIVDQIYNGVPDWLYEEEIISSNKAIYWSTRNRFAYIQFDDTNVTYDWWPVYGNEIYPKIRRIPYPKAGGVNPTVKLLVVSDAASHTGTIEIKFNNSFSEYYVLSVVWITNEVLVVTWINRPQNWSIITRCDLSWEENGAVVCKVIQEEKSETGWVTMHGAPFSTVDGSHLAQIWPQNEGGGFGYYNHIAFFNTSESKDFRFLTKKKKVPTATLR